jgi:tyrosyl-tRNA synthetase
MLNVLKLTTTASLNRARRSKDEVGRKMDDPKVSQMVYPMMQAIDIALLG